MKKIILVIALLIIGNLSQAQQWPINKETGIISFTEVVLVDSASKNDLYLKANEWFAKTFNDSKEVIQMNDKESGRIVGKGAFKVYAHSMGLRDYGRIYYTISITVKDGRYKYELTDIYHDAKGGFQGAASGGSLSNVKPDCGMYMTAKVWAEIKENSYPKCTSIIESLTSFMKAASNNSEESW